MLNTMSQLEDDSYEGKFLAVVVDNKDPLMQQRIRVRIPKLLESETDSLPWILPDIKSDFGMTSKSYSVGIPVIGSTVIVEFQNGDIHYGAASGDAHTGEVVLDTNFTTNYPNRRGFKDPAGNLFFIDSTPSQEDVKFIHKSGTTIHIDPTGNVRITASANTFTTVAGNVDLAVSGNARIAVSGSITSSAASWSHSGPVNISGNTAISGNVTVSSGDVTADGISLKTHRHRGVKAGGDTSSTPT